MPYVPKPDPVIDRLFLAIASLIAAAILVILGVALFRLARQVLALRSHAFAARTTISTGWMAAAGPATRNSLHLASLDAVLGSTVIFSGAYLLEKARGFVIVRNVIQFLALLPLAVPGLVLGLGYIFFFNNPANPLHFIYGTMAILVLCTVAHFYSVAHLTAVTALKQIDPEFETVGRACACRSTRHSRGHAAGQPAGAARHRHLPVRECHDDGVGRRVPLFALDDAWPRLPCSIWTMPATSRRRRRWR